MLGYGLFWPWFASLLPLTSWLTVVICLTCWVPFLGELSRNMRLLCSLSLSVSIVCECGFPEVGAELAGVNKIGCLVGVWGLKSELGLAWQPILHAHG